MKEKVAMIQLTLLGDTDATELSTSALIRGDGANQCNIWHENARKIRGGGWYRVRLHSHPRLKREGVWERRTG